MRKRPVAAIWLMAFFGACESMPPLPELPPPGRVRTADHAIRIAINACDPVEPGARRVKRWNAHFERDRWIVSFIAPRQHAGGPPTTWAEVLEENGKVLGCDFIPETVVIPD